MQRRNLIRFTVAAAAAVATTAAVAQVASSVPALPQPTTSGYAPVNGVEVWYQTYGAGEPLVLLHGGFGSIEMFGPVIPILAQTRQVIGVDLQAHGRTLPHDRPMTFENMATDIAGLIRSLGFEKADVMGYSMGGGVALRTAIDHPDVVDQLVLVSTPYAFSGWHDFNQQGMRSLNEAAAEAMKQTPMYQFYTQIAPDPANWTKAVGQIGGLAGTDYDWSAEVTKITAPTLILVADYDAVRIQHATRFFELLGGGKADGGFDGSGMTPNRFAVIPGATHYSLFSDPRIADTALSFLDPVNPAAASAPAQ